MQTSALDKQTTIVFKATVLSVKNAMFWNAMQSVKLLSENTLKLKSTNWKEDLPVTDMEKFIQATPRTFRARQE